MKIFSRHLLFLALTVVTSHIYGQETLFPSSNMYPAYTPIAEKIYDLYADKARYATNMGDLDGLASAIEVLADLNIFNEPVKSGIIENQKGILNYYKSDNNKALSCYLDALYYFNRAGSSEGINLIMNNIAIIFAQIEDYESTRKYLIKAIEYTPGEDITSRSVFMYNLAETESKLGNCQSGIRIASEVLDIYDPNLISFSEVALYGIIIGCYNNMGDALKASEWIELGMRELGPGVTYLDRLAFFSEAIEYYFKSGDYEKVLELGKNIYPAPDTSFTRDMYESIDLMAVAARKTGDLALAVELNRVANRIEFTRTSVSREDLITPLMEEYSYNRDISERDLLRIELMESSIKEKSQRRLLILLVVISVIMAAIVIVLSRTRRIRQKYKSAIISENRKLELINEEMRAHNLELERENKLVDTLISVFAHDLINPFQAILGFSQLMISDHDILEESDFLEYSELLSETSFQLNQLLINLKSMSIVQDKSRGLEKTRFKLSPVVNNILRLFEPSARKKGITFNLDSCASPEVYINQDIFESVFRNVISNAVKFSKQDGTIDIRCERTASEIEISVRDYGIGMPENIKEALISKKYLESRPGTSNEKGSGIGLAICIELLEMFDASIEIISEVGAGTTIIIEIPSMDEDE